MSKTLGQMNMETFAALIRTDGTYPPWAAHTPDSKAAWQAAAEAVALECGRRTGKQWDAERAVIEAVRDEINSPLAMRSWANLEDAIRALDSEEE